MIEMNGVGKDRSLSTAIHIMTVLAYGHPETISSNAIALGLRTNPGLVRRVLLKLADKGLVVSSKGKTGGHRLARPADKISLDEIYLAVKEGPLFGSFDKEPYPSCKVSCNIGPVLTDTYAGLEVGLLENMRNVKLSEVLSGIG